MPKVRYTHDLGDATQPGEPHLTDLNECFNYRSCPKKYTTLPRLKNAASMAAVGLVSTAPAELWGTSSGRLYAR